MGAIGEFKAALDQERMWYLVALRAAEADLRTISPEPVSLEQVRARIAVLEQEFDRPASAPPSTIATRQRARWWNAFGI